MNQPIRIELPTLFGMKTVNSYLFTTPEVVLVDCGEDTDASYKALQNGLAKEGLNIKDIERIVITHAHIDHIGMAHRVSEASGAMVHVPEYAYEWAVNLSEMRDRRLKVITDCMDEIGVPKTNRLYKNFVAAFAGFDKFWGTIPTEKVIIFPMTGTIELGGATWEVLYTPGHCISQVSFYQPDNKAFISADMLLKITSTPVIDPILEPPYTRQKSILIMLKTFERISKLDIETVYPGHYEPFNNHKEMIANQVQRIHKRKLQCLALIEEGVQFFQELLTKMYGKNFPFPAFPMLIGYLDLLIDEGKIIRTSNKEGQIFYSTLK